ncbi:hypothetical protein [Runella salmonicolor]|uniref:Uncharacterized protein n=1 Tax=Runella salmonicolor TaxID=2950278 RepID=A0ABT1FM87_9BACT|nr:hypothetical protein [Runella salmonicolor]MCP1381632.1 hypothetical protein [Runella salmonicolor]
MKPTQSINYRYIIIFFIVFFLCAIVGFWNSYFTRIFDQENYRMHTHGMALIMWLVILIIQPYLIRTKKVRLHRTLGKFSYLLVPILVFTTLDLLKYSLSKFEQLGSTGYFFVALVVNALIAYLIFYGLAIYHKRKANIHARYMICTAFPMFTPITDRIIGNYIPSLVAYVPTIDRMPVVPVIGFLMADLILVGLSIWDIRSNKRWNIFPVALVILLLYHFSVLNFYKYPFWQSFCEWFHVV